VKLLRRTFLQLAGAATAPTFSRVAMAQVYRWEIPTRELNTESRPPPPTSFKREQPGFGDDLRGRAPAARTCVVGLPGAALLVAPTNGTGSAVEILNSAAYTCDQLADRVRFLRRDQPKLRQCDQRKVTCLTAGGVRRAVSGLQLVIARHPDQAGSVTAGARMPLRDAPTSPRRRQPASANRRRPDAGGSTLGSRDHRDEGRRWQ
jgi:hypothetical protein